MKAWLYEGTKSFRLIDRPQPRRVRAKWWSRSLSAAYAVPTSRCTSPGSSLRVSLPVTRMWESSTRWARGRGLQGGRPGGGGRTSGSLRRTATSVCTGGPTSARTGSRTPPVCGRTAVWPSTCWSETCANCIRCPTTCLLRTPYSMDSMAVALRGIQQSAFKIGDSAVVSGAGSIGLSAVQLLKLGGARHVTALDVVPEKRELAVRFGADLALDPAVEGDFPEGSWPSSTAAWAPIWSSSAPERPSRWRPA